MHSHAIAWGSGSGQQSVTATGVTSDRNSLWVVKEASNGPICEAGKPIECGGSIRFEHATTGKNLHSHLFRAALSGNQEVSGFGDGGNGDTGDNWKIVCETSGAKYWERSKPISIVHADTGKYLMTSSTFKFTHQNCGGQCPILDQTEVSCGARPDARSKWQTGQGVYFPSKPSGGRGEAEQSDDEDL